MADTLRKIEREKAKKARQDAARHKRAYRRARQTLEAEGWTLARGDSGGVWIAERLSTNSDGSVNHSSPARRVYARDELELLENLKQEQRPRWAS